VPNAEGREDAHLLAMVAGRDQYALAALYRRRGYLIYSLLVRMLVNEMEAQEVMQDTFIQIWQRAAHYDPERSSALAWMLMRLPSAPMATEVHAHHETTMDSSGTPPNTARQLTLETNLAHGASQRAS
jgi:RNA polymerase sigma-70 factor (ECF subfamily)